MTFIFHYFQHQVQEHQ